MIYRRRRRARVRSVSWRTLLWLIEFEAAYRVVVVPEFTGARLWFFSAWAGMRRQRRLAMVAAVLRHDPARGRAR